MAADVLGGRVDDDVGAEVEGPAEIGAGEGVVHDQGHAGLVGDAGHGLEVSTSSLGLPMVST